MNIPHSEKPSAIGSGDEGISRDEARRGDKLGCAAIRLTRRVLLL
jgi:hypothetical protein